MAMTPEEKAERATFREEHPRCWMCLFLGTQQHAKTELHHIAGRGRDHDVLENYAMLCSEHHAALQSRSGAELICLALKKLYDPEYYSPEAICRLRGRAETCWTEIDVCMCQRVMDMTKECCK